MSGGPALGGEVSQIGRATVLLVCEHEHIAWHLVGGGGAGHELAVEEVVAMSLAQIGRGVELLNGNHNAGEVGG